MSMKEFYLFYFFFSRFYFVFIGNFEFVIPFYVFSSDFTFLNIQNFFLEFSEISF